MAVTPCDYQHGLSHKRSLWPPRSPDLSPQKDFLFGGGGYLKDIVYKNSSYSLDALKQNIQYFILNVTTETLHKVASNMRKGVVACIAKRGGHF